MHFTIAAVAAALVSAVMADQAYPTAPTANTIWTPGQVVNVAWKLTTPGDKTALSVDLFKGDPTKQTLVQKMGTGEPGATKLSVTIPANASPDWYSIRIGDSWSHYFMIKGKDGATPKGSMPTSVAPGATDTGSAIVTGTSAGSTTKATDAPTPAPNGASYLSAAPLTVAALVGVAAALAF